MTILNMEGEHVEAFEGEITQLLQKNCALRAILRRAFGWALCRKDVIIFTTDNELPNWIKTKVVPGKGRTIYT
jgi:hypothetical protein